MGKAALQIFNNNEKHFANTNITKDMVMGEFIPNAYEENEDIVQWIVNDQYVLALFLVTNYIPIDSMLRSDVKWAGKDLEEFKKKNPVTYDLLKESAQGAFTLAALHGHPVRRPELEPIIFTDGEYTAEYSNLVGPVPQRLMDMVEEAGFDCDFIEDEIFDDLDAYRRLVNVQLRDKVTEKSHPTELHLCEVNRLILHPDQTYVFRYDPNCALCKQYINGTRLEGE